ncbi:MAG: hypothetical protein E6I32_13720 [Chloroflexi bacterium]|nr:MAG: hypothetical protein E6I32_13720 [Chloroflexota bacterium]
MPSLSLMAGQFVPAHSTTLSEADAETMSPSNRLVAPALTGLLWPANASSSVPLGLPETLFSHNAAHPQPH